jgi:hypothetical protein
MEKAKYCLLHLPGESVLVTMETLKKYGAELPYENPHISPANVDFPSDTALNDALQERVYLNAVAAIDVIPSSVSIKRTPLNISSMPYQDFGKKEKIE